MTTPRGPDPSATAGAPRLVAALVVILALVTGLILGVAVDRRLLLRGRGAGPFGGRPPFATHGPGGRHGPPTERIRDYFKTQLGLSPAQMTQVDSIMSQQMAKRRAFDDTMTVRSRALMDSTRAAVDRVLTPDQRQKLAALRAHRDSLRGGPGGRGRFGP